MSTDTKKPKSATSKGKATDTTTKTSIWQQLFHNEPVNFVLGIILTIFAIFMFVSLVSFLFTGEADQSVIESENANKSLIQNWTGYFGACLSSILFNKWIGLSAFILPVWLFFIGRRLMRIGHLRVIRFTTGCALSMIVLSLLLGFIFFNHQDTFLVFGGTHGHLANEWLNGWIGRLGTALVILVITIILLVQLSQNTIKYIRRVSSVSLAAQALKERKEKARKEEEKKKEEKSDKEKNSELPKDEPTSQSIEPEEDNEGEAEQAQEEEVYEEVEKPETEDEEVVEEEITQPLTIETDDPNFVIATGKAEELTSEVAPIENYDPTKDLSHYKRPTFDLLEKRENSEVKVNIAEQTANKQQIIDTLKNYGIEISSISATVGPTVTLYEIKPAPGVRIARIKNLENDIALSLSALGIRIIAPIPGKGTVGIEVPNKEAKVVSMYSVLASKKFQECKYELPIALGKTITNEVCIADLCKMPHILVAGATGQGKSVGLNAIITSLLYKKHPAQLKFVLIDPKRVEFSIYSVIERHFMAKLPDAEKAVITDSDKVIATLNSLCIEMENRYGLLELAKVRTIKEYNDLFIQRKLNPKNGHKFMPYIVVIIDEFCDLIMMAGRDIETPIARIAQKARAVGIHMIIATQRPSATVITGNIKANFPARIAFRVMQRIDSQVILDTPGANQLIGRGDMLLLESGELKRVQCAFIDTPEVRDICDYISNQQGYPEAYELPEYQNPDSETGGEGADLSTRDPLFEEAAKMIVVSGQGSTSLLQRRYSIGYNRAGRLMDQLEAAGIVGPSEGGKPRQVLIADIMALENKLDLMK